MARKEPKLDDALSPRFAAKTRVRIQLAQAREDLQLLISNSTISYRHADQVRARLRLAIEKIAKADELVVTELRSK